MVVNTARASAGSDMLALLRDINKNLDKQTVELEFQGQKIVFAIKADFPSHPGRGVTGSHPIIDKPW